MGFVEWEPNNSHEGAQTDLDDGVSVRIVGRRHCATVDGRGISRNGGRLGRNYRWAWSARRAESQIVRKRVSHELVLRTLRRVGVFRRRSGVNILSRQSEEARGRRSRNWIVRFVVSV